MLYNLRRRMAVLAVVVATLSAVLLGSTEGQARLAKWFGQLTTVEVECDTFCTQGTLTGGLAGTLHWRMDEMQETDVPNVMYAVGVNTITTDRGTLEGTDYLLWNIDTGEFVDFTIISKGTGDYAGKRGTLTIVGVFDPVAAQGSSNYIALVH